MPESRIDDGSRRRLVLRVVLVLTVVGLVGAGVVLLARDASRSQEPVKPTAITPAEQTRPATTAVSPDTTMTGNSTPTGTPAPVDSAGTGSDPARVARIAFRLGQTIYMAQADGSQPIPVGRFSDGTYALSPDGRTLAVVAAQRLSIIEIDGLVKVDVGEASGSGPLMGECPVWTPDSRFLLFARQQSGGDGTTEVWRVRRDGSGAKKLVAGKGPSVSPDGRTVAVLADAGRSDEDAGAILVSRDGARFQRVPVKGGRVTVVAAGDQRLFVGVLADDGTSRIVSMRPDGGGVRTLHGTPTDMPRATWGVLKLSPDGSRLAAVATGDDQSSRVSILSTDSTTVVAVSQRRDGYVKFWDLAGSYLYIVEGNAYQGEPTALTRVAADGSGRQVLVTGAQ